MKYTITYYYDYDPDEIWKVNYHIINKDWTASKNTSPDIFVNLKNTRYLLYKIIQWHTKCLTTSSKSKQDTKIFYNINIIKV